MIDLKKVAEDWDKSHLNANNPDAISLATISRALRERDEQRRLLDRSDQCLDSELPRTPDSSI